MGSTCPYCKIGNNWVKCGACGDVYCGACKTNRSGKSERKDSWGKCPTCGKNSAVRHVSPPSWAK